MPVPGSLAVPPQRQHSKKVRIIALTLLALIVIAGLVVLITWLTIRPKDLKYSIEKGSIATYNLTNDRLNADFKFTLRADNPNKRVSVYYDKIVVTVLYEDRELSINDVHPFYQPSRNVTHLNLNLVAKNASAHGEVGEEMKMERRSGKLDLEVKMRAKIRFKAGIFKIRRTVKVHCAPMIVPLFSYKSYDDQSCDVDID